ncbi:CoA transferase [Pedococcus sp. 5OH_020]|uniref:CoA transferase n=1 Tax=Pedococcus sp. 5OH_020 TaxID=2989814 RepID=UPI0022E9F5C6|nr:CoA transferase [Pedococcus sp. 5OH_020]
MNPLLREVLPALGLEPGYVAQRLDVRPGNALAAALPVGTLATGAVAAAALAGLALRSVPPGSQAPLPADARAHVDPRQVAVAFRNDQLQTVHGVREAGFAPLSGFFEARDGWVRTHANYPHHLDRLVRALGLPSSATREDAAAAIATRAAQDVEDAVTRDHGIAVRVRSLREWMEGEPAAAVDTHPLLAVTRLGHAPSRPVPERPRVLDLTRVIAGPVATRTLAYLGCDVLRVDSPRMPELTAAHLETDAGKRSTLLDLHDEHARRRFHELLDGADVLVTGYRPGALDAYGLEPRRLAQSHPQVVHAALSAWTPDGPWGDRRGFDSIVQAATGIALLESPDGSRPRALPAQALDHATGYLLAAGILAALRHRGATGGTWHVAAHLARTAHWLLRTDAVDVPAQPVRDPGPWLVRARTEHGTVVQARPAFELDGGRDRFAWVGKRWGGDEARWADVPQVSS